MALDTKISTAARNAACNAVVDLIDAGAAAGYIQIRTGAPPANCAAANSGTLLGTLNMSDPAFGNAANGVATASAISNDTSADASGDAGHFRVFDSDNNCILQGTAGEAGDTPNMVFDEKSIVAGGVIAITAMTVTQPEQGS